jgi:hypothetical protein
VYPCPGGGERPGRLLAGTQHVVARDERPGLVDEEYRQVAQGHAGRVTERVRAERADQWVDAVRTGQDAQ